MGCCCSCCRNDVVLVCMCKCVMPFNLKSGLSIFHWTFLRGALSLINPTHKMIKYGKFFSNVPVHYDIKLMVK
jgi:hypothetical protein